MRERAHPRTRTPTALGVDAYDLIDVRRGVAYPEAMLKAGVGQSSRTDTRAAIEEAARHAMEGLSGETADLALLYATVDHAGPLEQELTTLGLLTGTPEIVGCSGLGILTENGEVEGESGIAVMALASDTVRPRRRCP